MKRSLFVAVLLGSACLLLAQDAPTIPPLSGKLGTPIELFNAKDLAGWTWFADPATPAKTEDVWTVKDGILHCVGKPNGYIRTEKDFGPDYVLTVEYRHVTRGGGGFLFGISGPDKIWPKTMQVQGAYQNVGEVVNQGDFNWFVDQARFKTDRLTKLGPASEKALGEWSVMELTVDHGNLIVKVNDKLQNTATGMDDVTGKIGFQSEGATMEYRKVTLTPIEKK